MIRIQTAAAINSDRSLATKWDLAKRARLKRAGIAQGRGYVIEHAARSIRMALIPAMGRGGAFRAAVPFPARAYLCKSRNRAQRDIVCHGLQTSGLRQRASGLLTASIRQLPRRMRRSEGSCEIARNVLPGMRSTLRKSPMLDACRGRIIPRPGS